MEQIEGSNNEPSESPAEESINQEAVNNPEVASQEQPTTTEEAGTPEAESPPLQQTDVDDLGVPYKNRYEQAQRLLEKTTEQNNAILEKLGQLQGQKQETKYSVEELEDFAENTDNQAHRQWAKSEIRKLQKEEIRNEMTSVLRESQQAQQAEKTKADALNYVMNRYPEAFRKDASGKIVGWNDSSPLAQRIGMHMQDKELANNPRGLIVASALAYSEVAPTVAAQAQTQAVKAQAQAKNLQKQTLTEGGGVSSPTEAKSPVSAAKQRLMQTGSTKDGASVFKEMLKSRGRIKEG